MNFVLDQSDVLRRCCEPLLPSGTSVNTERLTKATVAVLLLRLLFMFMSYCMFIPYYMCMFLLYVYVLVYVYSLLYVYVLIVCLCS